MYNLATFLRNKAVDGEKVTRVEVAETGKTWITDVSWMGNHCMGLCHVGTHVAFVQTSVHPNGYANMNHRLRWCRAQDGSGCWGGGGSAVQGRRLSGNFLTSLCEL